MEDTVLFGELIDLGGGTDAQVITILIKKLVFSRDRHRKEHQTGVIFPAQPDDLFDRRAGLFRQSPGSDLRFVIRRGHIDPACDLRPVYHLLCLREKIPVGQLLPPGMKSDQGKQKGLIVICNGEIPDNIKPVFVQIRHCIRNIVDILGLHLFFIGAGKAAVQHDEGGMVLLNDFLCQVIGSFDRLIACGQTIGGDSVFIIHLHRINSVHD